MPVFTVYKPNKSTAATAMTATKPSAAGDGVDVSQWKSGPHAPQAVVVLIDGDATMTVTGAELWGYVATSGATKWRVLGKLNNGETITISGANQGHAEEVGHVAMASRLAVVGTEVGGNATYMFAPLDLE